MTYLIRSPHYPRPGTLGGGYWLHTKTRPTCRSPETKRVTLLSWRSRSERRRLLPLARPSPSDGAPPPPPIPVRRSRARADGEVDLWTGRVRRMYSSCSHGICMTARAVTRVASDGERCDPFRSLDVDEAGGGSGRAPVRRSPDPTRSRLVYLRRLWLLRWLVAVGNRRACRWWRWRAPSRARLRPCTTMPVIY